MTTAHGSLVFVPENTRYQFTPQCDNNFLEFARSLPIGLGFAAQRGNQPSTCNGYFGVVVNPKDNGNGIVTFDLVWGHEPDQNFRYTTSTRRIRHIGCVSTADADTLAAAILGPSDADTVRPHKASDSQSWFRLRMRVRPA